MNSNLKPVTPLIVAHFIQANERFSLLKADSQEALIASEWLEKNFPIASWGNMVWNEVPDSFCLAFTDFSELTPAFEKLASKNELKGEVTILWTNAFRSPMEVDLEVVLKYSSLFFEEDWDTWIYSSKNRWCIEIFHDGEICLRHTYNPGS